MQKILIRTQNSNFICVVFFITIPHLQIIHTMAKTNESLATEHIDRNW